MNKEPPFTAVFCFLPGALFLRELYPARTKAPAGQAIN